MATFVMENPGIAILCLLAAALLGFILWAMNEEDNKKRRALNQAKHAYDTSLDHLRGRPSDPELRKRTLDLGRIYSDLSRQKTGVTVYDEVALMNDINAACAAGGLAPAHTAPAKSTRDRLAEIVELRKSGLLSDEEYKAKGAELLKEI